MQFLNKKQKSIIPILTLSMVLFVSISIVAKPSFVQALSVHGVHQTFAADEDTIKVDNESDTRDTCGAGDNAVKTAIDIGCKGLGNPILDALFAIIRFLTVGAGLVMIGSMIVAGIQYTSSRGDPQATAAAIKRIASTFGALLLFIFIYAIANWLIPAGLLR